MAHYLYTCTHIKNSRAYEYASICKLVKCEIQCSFSLSVSIYIVILSLIHLTAVNL